MSTSSQCLFMWLLDKPCRSDKDCFPYRGMRTKCEMHPILHRMYCKIDRDGFQYPESWDVWLYNYPCESDKDCPIKDGRQTFCYYNSIFQKKYFN